VKANEVPFIQEETRAGFRYLFEASVIPVIAHKASMRRPSGRSPYRRPEGYYHQPSSAEGLQEASSMMEELAAIRAERDLLRVENSRLWSQVDRLTDSVTRLALPASRPPEEVPSEEETGRGQPERRGFWDWFFGRPPKA